MTREEAIQLLRDIQNVRPAKKQALNMAIEALERPDAIDVLLHFFSDEPCNYNNMDDKTDEWCAEHCCGHTVRACWEHAIKERWYE